MKMSILMLIFCTGLSMNHQQLLMAPTVTNNERFPEFSEKDLVDLLNNKDAKNTKKCNKMAVSIFESYLSSKEEFREYTSGKWTELSSANLARILRKFYAEAGSQKGELYKKSTMLCLRNSLNRHLNELLRSRGNNTVDFTKDAAFGEANSMLQVMKKVLKESNKGAVVHHDAVSPGDLRKMRAYFIENKTSPRALQQQVFVNIMLRFWRRGRENIRKLKITDFAITTDDEGSLYLYQKTDERTKNYQCDNDQKSAKMYQMKDDDECCPVKTFVKYKKKLNPECIFLFQRPKQKVNDNDKVWYDKIAIGERTIGSMMSDISEAAQLSKRYTNHCLRATTVTLLDEGGQEGRHIVAITQHASTASLSSYSKVSDKRMKTMSNIISDGFSRNLVTSDDPPATVTGNVSTAQAPLAPTSSGDSNTLQAQPIVTLSAHKSPTRSPTQQLLSLSPNLNLLDDDLDGFFRNVQSQQVLNQNRSVFQPTFHNCSVNINYNFK